MTPSPQKWSLKPRERQNRRKLRFRRRITAKRSARGEWYISKEMSASKSWTLMKKCPKSLNRLRHPLKGQKTKIFWKIVKNRAFGGAYRPNGSPVADNAYVKKSASKSCTNLLLCVNHKKQFPAWVLAKKTKIATFYGWKPSNLAFSRPPVKSFLASRQALLIYPWNRQGM